MLGLFKQNIARKLGYIQDQKGILRRYKREKNAWESHLSNTKEYIKEQIDGCRFKSVAVLGSGYLLDLPLAELLACSDSIFLYDIHHPKKITNKFAQDPKVKCIQQDITGLSNQIAKKPSRTELEKLLSLPMPQWNIAKHDCIISLNILNQLDILLLDYIHGAMPCPKELENRLRAKIQTDHIDSFGDTFAILIADTHEIRTNIDSDETETACNLHCDLTGNGSAYNHKTWEWHFDNSGRYIENRTVKFQVNAVTYNKHCRQCAE